MLRSRWIAWYQYRLSCHTKQTLITHNQAYSSRLLLLGLQDCTDIHSMLDRTDDKGHLHLKSGVALDLLVHIFLIVS